MKICAMLMSTGWAVVRLRPVREKRKNAVGRFCSDHSGELFERRVRGGELAFAAVDEHEIGKWSAFGEQLAVPAQHNLVNSCEVILIPWWFGLWDLGFEWHRLLRIAIRWSARIPTRIPNPESRIPSDLVLPVLAAPHSPVLAHHHRRNRP